MIAEPSELASRGTQVTTLPVVVGSLLPSDPYPQKLHPQAITKVFQSFSLSSILPFTAL